MGISCLAEHFVVFGEGISRFAEHFVGIGGHFVFGKQASPGSIMFDTPKHSEERVFWLGHFFIRMFWGSLHGWEPV